MELYTKNRICVRIWQSLHCIQLKKHRKFTYVDTCTLLEQFNEETIGQKARKTFPLTVIFVCRGPSCVLLCCDDVIFRVLTPEGAQVGIIINNLYIT